jgi:lysophospholipase L1-like esterase
VSGHFEIDNEVALNSLGFYDDEPADAASVGLRVLAVGDSFTAALNVPRDEVWTAVLERELRARGYSDADVVNLGLDGTGTDVQLELLREYVPRFRPQVVLLAFFANDLEDVQNGPFTRECYREFVLSYQTPAQRDALRARVDAHAQRRVLRALADHSLLARLGLAAWEGPRTLFRLNFLQPSRAELGLTPERLRERAPRARESFEALARFAERCDCGLVIAPVPARRELGASLQLAREVSAGLPLPIVDVLPGMRASLAADRRTDADLFFVHDAHLNAYGNRLYARALADAVAWPPQPAAPSAR